TGGPASDGATTVGGEPGDRRGGINIDVSNFDRAAEPRAQGSPSRQTVLALPTVDGCRVCAPEHPADSRARHFRTQLCQSQERVRRRMPSTDDKSPPPGEMLTVTAGHIGQRRGDEPAATGLDFAGRCEPGLADRVRAL